MLKFQRCINKKPFIFLIFLIISTLLFQLYLFNEEYEKQPLSNQFTINRHKTNTTLNITILIIVHNLKLAEIHYKTAINSVRCYSNIHNYKLKIVEEQEFEKYCRQKSSLLRRYCIIAHLLKETDIEWLTYLDADVAIVNPNVKIEEYVDSRFDLTLYEKFDTWQIASNSMIIRNSPWAHNFLMKFSNFASKFGRTGTMNAALLHIFLQKKFHPQLSDDVSVCMKILKWAKTAENLFTFETCIRTVMGDLHEFGKTRILRKGTAWVRDIYLTDSKWSPERDFMLHGLAEKKRLPQGDTPISPFNWKSPFLEQIGAENCGKLWNYDQKSIISQKEVEKLLGERFEAAERRKWKTIAQVADFI